jgi:hypothetical protein
LSSSLDGSNPAPNIEPLKVYNIIQKMNKKAATVPNDIPMKLIDEFSVELAFPLSHIITFCLKNGVYPNIWKIESVTPVPKIFLLIQKLQTRLLENFSLRTWHTHMILHNTGTRKKFLPTTT